MPFDFIGPLQAAVLIRDATAPKNKTEACVTETIFLRISNGLQKIGARAFAIDHKIPEKYMQF